MTKRVLLWMRYLWLGGLWLGLLACQPRVQFDLPGGCRPPQSLQTHLEQNQQIPGCLVVLWEANAGAKPSVHPIQLAADGSLTLLSEDGSPDPNGDFSLPPEARGKSLLFRIYVAEPSAAPSDFAAHKALCGEMGDVGFYCFAPGGACWLSIQVQPTSDQGSHPIRQLAGGTCQVCQREVCDGQDNNCNGKVDEFDEQSGRACPTPQP